MKRHPAKFNPAVIDAIRHELKWFPHIHAILDPFAGVGGIHVLQDDGYFTLGIEIEPEWAYEHPNTLCANALKMHQWFPEHFDAIVTSPCYGNRMADHHNAADNSKRHTYRHYLQRPPDDASSATMQWGPQYRFFHLLFLNSAALVLRRNGLLVINMSNHYRKGVKQKVVRWWKEAIIAAGFDFLYAVPVRTRRLRHGRNHELRPQCEWLLIARRSDEEPRAYSVIDG